MGYDHHFAKQEMVWTLAVWCCALHPPVRPEKTLQGVRINHAAGEDQISFCHYSPVGKALMTFKGSRAGCMRGQHGMRDHIWTRKGTGGGISASSKDAII